MGIDAGLYPVRHQAFITRRLPMLGKNGANLDMLIDRQDYKGFSAVYGQQIAYTGQIIGCASPKLDAMRIDKNLKLNTKAFLEIVSEMFVEWIPDLAGVSSASKVLLYFRSSSWTDDSSGCFLIR